MVTTHDFQPSICTLTHFMSDNIRKSHPLVIDTVLLLVLCYNVAFLNDSCKLCLLIMLKEELLNYRTTITAHRHGTDSDSL